MQSVPEGNHMNVVNTTLLSLLLAGGTAVAGETTPPVATTAQPVATQTDVKVAVTPANAKSCAYTAGTRIRPSPAMGCKSAVGPTRVFTQEDLQRTGEVDLNAALRKLDPIFH
jgi:hypothetical protein